MGISTFWEILGPYAAETDVQVQSLSGRKVAVDLSSWIVEFSASTPVPNNVIKLLFFRTVTLMREGIQLVFVEDGRAPDLKCDTLHQRQLQQYGACRAAVSQDRPRLQRAAAECKPMLKALGIPCVKSPAEAEAMCAYLDMKGYVDGCFTNDSDFFCYGGKTLYRSLRMDKKGYVIDLYKDENIKIASGLSRREMVAMALLLRSDYDQKGVPGIGKETFKSLLKYFKSKDLDMLDRLLCWRDNEELDFVERECKQRLKRGLHCSCCNHLGTRQGHERWGCIVCTTVEDCIKDHETVKPCSCPWHEQERLEAQHKLELTARRKALSHSDFPNKQVMNEYMTTLTANSVDVADLETREIDVPQLISGLRGRMSSAEILKKLVPTVIYLQLRKKVRHEDLMYTPIRIVRTSQEKFVASYLVAWDKTYKNSWAVQEFSTDYEVNVDQTLFSQNYPSMVRQFEVKKANRRMFPTKKSSGQKRKTEDPHQPKLEFCILPKRRLTFDSVTEPPVESSSSPEVYIDHAESTVESSNNRVEESITSQIVGCKAEPITCTNGAESTVESGSNEVVKIKAEPVTFHDIAGPPVNSPRSSEEVKVKIEPMTFSNDVESTVESSSNEVVKIKTEPVTFNDIAESSVHPPGSSEVVKVKIEPMTFSNGAQPNVELGSNERDGIKTEPKAFNDNVELTVKSSNTIEIVRCKSEPMTYNEMAESTVQSSDPSEVHVVIMQADIAEPCVESLNSSDVVRWKVDPVTSIENAEPSVDPVTSIENAEPSVRPSKSNKVVGVKVEPMTFSNDTESTVESSSNEVVKVKTEPVTFNDIAEPADKPPKSSEVFRVKVESTTFSHDAESTAEPGSNEVVRCKVEPVTFNDNTEATVESSNTREVVGIKVESNDQVVSPKLVPSGETELVVEQKKPSRVVDTTDQVASKSQRKVVFSKSTTGAYNCVDINKLSSSGITDTKAEVICIDDSDEEQLGGLENNIGINKGKSTLGKVGESASWMTLGMMLGNNKDKLESSSNSKKENKKRKTPSKKQSRASKLESSKQGNLLKYFTVKKS